MVNLNASLASDQHIRKAEAITGINKLFLSESLKLMGPITMSGSFSGGNGEQQFSSFLIDAYAEVASRRIDLGIN